VDPAVEFRDGLGNARREGRPAVLRPGWSLVSVVNHEALVDPGVSGYGLGDHFCRDRLWLEQDQDASCTGRPAAAPNSRETAYRFDQLRAPDPRGAPEAQPAREGVNNA
jgi:hypothetical protein